jgi:hypothetical protein
MTKTPSCKNRKKATDKLKMATGKAKALKDEVIETKKK